MLFEEYFNTHFGKKVAVCGLGVSNLPLIRLLCDRAIAVEARDRKSEEDLGQTALTIRAMGAKLICGEGYLDDIDADIIYRSPGMRPDIVQFADAVRRGATLTSEMEAFFEVCPCRTIGVTGSDGKSTTSTIISRMLEMAGYRVWLGGNIGLPLLDRVPDMKREHIAVVELSSFQLMTMSKSPEIAVVTNVSENHLDVHKDFDEYIESKKNIFCHQNASGITVLNWDNKITRGYAASAKGDVRYFSHRESQEDIRKGQLKLGLAGTISKNDIFMITVQDNAICVDAGNRHKKIIDIAGIRLPGTHNVENYMACIASIFDLCSSADVAEVARTFEGVEHRLEFVAEHCGVSFYNDSIASSPARTIAGLRSFNKKVVLIAGGYDKQLSYKPLAEELPSHVKALVLMGQTKDKIRTEVERLEPCVEFPVFEVQTMEEAVEAARRVSQSGDTILFSPASASFDMFKNFEQRGNAFKTIVNNIICS